MNYIITLTSNGQNPILLKKFSCPVELRPQLHQQLKIENDIRTFEVVATIPTDNPDNVTVEYQVDILTREILNYRKTAQTDFINRTLPK